MSNDKTVITPEQQLKHILRSSENWTQRGYAEHSTHCFELLDQILAKNTNLVKALKLAYHYIDQNAQDTQVQLTAQGAHEQDRAVVANCAASVGVNVYDT